MQQGLITCYSSLVGMDDNDRAALPIIKKHLVETGTEKAFNKLRRGAFIHFRMELVARRWLTGTDRFGPGHGRYCRGALFGIRCLQFPRPGHLFLG